MGKPFLGPIGARGILTEEEKRNRPKFSRALLLRIFTYLKPYVPQFLLVFFAILVSAVLGLLPPVIIGRIVDDALAGKDLTLLARLLLVAFVTLGLSRFIAVAEGFVSVWISQHIVFDLRNQMYDHLQHMPHAFFATEKQGDIITRMNADIDGVSTVVSRTLASVLSNLVVVATTLVALFSLNWKLAFLGVMLIPLLVLPAKRVGRKRWSLMSAGRKEQDAVNQIVDETLSVSGSLLVKLFTREKAEYRRFVAANERLTRLNLREQRSGSWFRLFIGLFSELSPLLIYFAGGMIIVGGWDDALTIGTITAVVALVDRLYRPVDNLLNVSVEFTRSLALFSRIFAYFDMNSSIRSPENGQKPDFAASPVVYDHVSFSYDGSRSNLEDISFTVPCGQMVAIVGPSGAGKSTVVNLLPRLYDVTGGSVRIGDTDVRDMDLECLRSQIGLVTQDAYLFNGTILENLLYAKPDATREEVESACRAANIHDFIASQPKGYGSEVGNRGLKLSGGEKQRLSIARVVLKNPKVVILDEATSALDSISESAIQDAFERILRGRTSIVIAHRLSTVMRSDRILVLSNGRIVERGTHGELLAAGGLYRELYETQFRKVLGG